MLGAWVRQGQTLRAEFAGAEPFPMVIIDGFVDDASADALIGEFPPIDSMPQSRDYVFGNKHELSSVEEAGPACAALYGELTGPTFADFLRELTGWELFVDPRFHGGGFHQGGDGSYLDMHADFNVHPLHDDWLRRLNILLYLNHDWQDEWGGSLLVKARPEDEPRAIAPLFNRAVIMETNDHTYHGYPKMTLPPGVTRRSIAAYAYERVAPGSVKSRTTGWVPEDAGLAKRIVARNYDSLVRVKNRFFGSGTARNR